MTNRNILTTLLIVFVCSFVGNVFSSDAISYFGDEKLSADVLKWLEKAPEHKEFPESKACWLLKQDDYTVNPDGSWNHYAHYIIKLYTYKAKKSYSNFKFDYDTTFQQYEIVQARSINPKDDGSWLVSPIPDHSVNEITPPYFVGASAYARKKQLVLSIPAVAETSYIEVEMNINSYGKSPYPFGGRFVLVDEDPVIRRDFTITSNGHSLKILETNGAPEVKEFGEKMRWLIQDYKGLTAIGGEPSATEFLPTLVVSYDKSWSESGSYFAKRFIPRIMVTSKIEEKVNEITGGVEGEAALWEIVDFISDEIRKVNVNLGEVDYIPEKAEDVLSNGYGDCRDISVLMISMLQAKGIEASPVLCNRTNQRIHEDIPTIAQFNHILVKAEIDGKTFFLDPYAENTGYGYIGRSAGTRGLEIELGNQNFLDIPGAKPADNKVTLTYNIALDSEGNISGTMNVKAVGSFDTDLRSALRDKKSRKIKQIMESITSGISAGASMTEYELGELDDFNKNTEFTVTFTAEDYASKQKDMTIFEFPDNVSDFETISLPPVTKDRDLPVGFDYPFEMTLDVNIEVPSEYLVVFVTPTQEITNEAGSLNIESSHKENKVKFTRTLKIKDTFISSEEYSNLKEVIRSFLVPKNNIMLLESKASYKSSRPNNSEVEEGK